MEVIHAKRDVQKEGACIRIPNNLWGVNGLCNMTRERREKFSIRGTSG